MLNRAGQDNPFYSCESTSQCSSTSINARARTHTHSPRPQLAKIAEPLSLLVGWFRVQTSDKLLVQFGLRSEFRGTSATQCNIMQDIKPSGAPEINQLVSSMIDRWIDPLAPRSDKREIFADGPRFLDRSCIAALGRVLVGRP